MLTQYTIMWGFIQKRMRGSLASRVALLSRLQGQAGSMQNCKWTSK